MRQKTFFTLIIVLSFGLSHALAQASAPILKDGTRGEASELYAVGDVKGTLKSPAVYIAKPIYPLEAQQIGADGAVRVRITVDEEGNVLSAQAIEGNSLLKTVCEEAARRTKFRIARDANGNAIKNEGVLTYNFTIQKAGWTRIGYGLSFFGKLPFSYFSIPTTAKAFAPEWTSELQMLAKLEKIGRTEEPPKPLVFVSQSSAITKTTTRAPNGTAEKTATMNGVLNMPPTGEEQTALAQNLILALQNRLETDELSLWQFNLGLSLSRAFQIFRNPNERGNAALMVRQFADNAPKSVSTELMTVLKNLAANFEKEKRSMETDDEISRLLTVILKNK